MGIWVVIGTVYLFRIRLLHSSPRRSYGFGSKGLKLKLNPSS